MSLQGKKILVTGGCGFIGSHVAQRLVDLGARVVILDDLSRGKEDNIADFRGKVAFIKGDIRDENILEEALEGTNVTQERWYVKKCPECGQTLRFESGCDVCDCGYSKCG